MSDGPAAIAGRRLRLKNYVFFRETPEGVWFDGGRRSFLLSGTKIYPVVARLIALMDQGSAWTAIEAAVPPRLLPLARRLVEALRAHEMLLESSSEVTPEVGATGHDAAVEFRRFLEDRIPHEKERMALLSQWRESQVLLIGCGFSLKAAAAAVAASGCGAIRLAPCGATPDGRAGLDEIAAALARFSANGGTLTLLATAEPRDIAAAGLVIVATDDPAVDAVALEEAARAQGVPVTIAAITRGHACVTAPMEAGHVRLADLSDWLVDRPADAPDHSPASLSVAGGLCAQTAINAWFGIGLEERRSAVDLVTPYLEIQRHPVISSPLLPRHDGPLSPPSYPVRFEPPPDRELGLYERLRVALEPWFDPLTGCFSTEQGRSVPQIPLYLDLIQLRLPRSLGAREHALLGWGVDAAGAGLDVVRKALSRLAVAELGEAPVVADFEPSRWRERAYALAAAQQPRFAKQRRCAWLAPEAIEYQPVRMLLRILRYFGRPEPRLLLQVLPGQPVAVAHAFVDGRQVAWACDCDVERALLSVVGDACCFFQAGELPVDATYCPALPDGDVGEAVPSEMAAVIGDERWSFRTVRSTALGLPEPIIAGYVAFDAAGSR